MNFYEEAMDFITGLLWTCIGIIVVGVIGAMCWWAWASESLFNILGLAGLMLAGVGLLGALLVAWLEITKEKQ